MRADGFDASLAAAHSTDPASVGREADVVSELVHIGLTADARPAKKGLAPNEGKVEVSAAWQAKVVAGSPPSPNRVSCGFLAGRPLIRCVNRLSAVARAKGAPRRLVDRVRYEPHRTIHEKSVNPARRVATSRYRLVFQDRARIKVDIVCLGVRGGGVWHKRVRWKNKGQASLEPGKNRCQEPFVKRFLTPVLPRIGMRTTRGTSVVRSVGETTGDGPVMGPGRLMAWLWRGERQGDGIPINNRWR